MYPHSAARAALAALLLVSLSVHAEELCSARLDLGRVLHCARASSLELRRAREELEALAGRRAAAGVWFPSLPHLALTAAARKPSPEETEKGTFFNWSATLAQEVDLAGKRGLRLEVVDAELASAVKRVGVSEQEVSAAAINAYFQLLAAQEGRALAAEIRGLARTLSDLAKAQAEAELVSRLDASLAEAEATRFSLLALEVERSHAQAGVQLSRMLGRDPALPPEVEGELAAPFGPGPAHPEEVLQGALRLRGEVASAEAERRVWEARVQLLRRERVPDFTVSGFYQLDGFNEKVAGGGLALPLPFPSPLWPSRQGELKEATARTAQAETDLQAVKRRVQVEVSQAWREDALRSEALKAFSPRLLSQAREQLVALREAIAARKLSVREALLAQRALIDLLQSHLEARLAAALARTELLRAAGLPFVGETP